MKLEPQINRGQKGLVGMLTPSALETLSPFIVLILLSCAAFGQNVLPNAPSASQPKLKPAAALEPTPALARPAGAQTGQHPDLITVDDIKDKGFFRGHPTRTKVIIAAIGGGVGLTIALVTRHNCPKYINGYRYDGTSPCPGKDYDPGGKRVGLRWRF